MSAANRENYLFPVVDILKAHWPNNRTVNIVCHGHSVPSGYFATPFVDTFNAYPHLLHAGLKQRFPFAVINVIVTAIGGENSESGAERFDDEVLCHRPDIILIDYALNDRRIGVEKSREAWARMIQAGLKYGAKIILLTPTVDATQRPGYEGDDKEVLIRLVEQVRELSGEYHVGLADSFEACHTWMKNADISDILCWTNHPSRNGHELIAKELLRWFPAYHDISQHSG